MVSNLHSFIRAEDIMSKDIFVVKVDSSIINAAKLMKKYNTSFLIAMEKTKPIGIITENDITKFVTTKKDPEKIKVSSIMSSPLITVNISNSFFAILKEINKNKIKRVPVKEGEMITGIISESEILKGIVYINKILNQTLREGYMSLEEHKKKEEELIKHVFEKGFVKEPPWVKKEIKLLKKIHQDQEEVIKKISKTSKKYTLTEWRTTIWPGCKYKKEKMKNKEIVYYCKKIKGYCSYKDCPLNNN